VLRGPASFSVNDECGLLVDGFDTPPTLMMPHNPRYYVTLLERAGFTKAKDLLVYQGGDPDHYKPVPERLARGTELIRQRMGVTLRPLDMKNFQAEVERIKELYNEGWEKNWGFVPMTEHEIDHLAEQFKPVVIPELVPMAEKDGKIIGFGIALPDLNVVFQGNRSGRMFPVVLKLLWALKTRKIRRARILLLGVLPEYRGKGVDAMLYHWIWTKSGQRGIYWGEAGWILEDNPAMNAGLEKMTFTVYKTYRLYDRPL
jgi:GNAT superfamily N-acetyltransferase